MPRKPREVLSRCRCGCVRKTFTQGLDGAEKALYNVFAKRLNAEGTESIAREFESSVVLDGTKTMLRQAWLSIRQKKTLSARA